MYLELGLEEEAIEAYFEKILERNYLTCFLNQHSELVLKLNSNFDKQCFEQSNPEIIQYYFTKVQQV